jgi:DNA-binding NarL/FixJ family response regulator
MRGKKAKVLLADDQEVVAEGLRRILEHSVDIVAAARTGPDALALAAKYHVDTVILDVLLPHLGGLEVGRRLLELEPSTRVLYFTALTDPTYVTEARRLGACGYIPKSCDRDELITAVKVILQGRSYFPDLLHSTYPTLMHGLEERVVESDLLPLTPRQRQVLRLVAEGLSGKEIAHRLCISTKTVEFHKAAITSELGLHTTAELVRYALEHHLLDESERL